MNLKTGKTPQVRTSCHGNRLEAVKHLSCGSQGIASVFLPLCWDDEKNSAVVLTLPMLMLRSIKAQESKIFENHLNPAMLVYIR